MKGPLRLVIALLITSCITICTFADGINFIGHTTGDNSTAVQSTVDSDKVDVAWWVRTEYMAAGDYKLYLIDYYSEPYPVIFWESDWKTLPEHFSPNWNYYQYGGEDMELSLTDEHWAIDTDNWQVNCDIVLVSKDKALTYMTEAELNSYPLMWVAFGDVGQYTAVIDIE